MLLRVAFKIFHVIRRRLWFRKLRRADTLQSMNSVLQQSPESPEPNPCKAYFHRLRDFFNAPVVVFAYHSVSIRNNAVSIVKILRYIATGMFVLFMWFNRENKSTVTFTQITSLAGSYRAATDHWILLQSTAAEKLLRFIGIKNVLIFSLSLCFYLVCEI